MDTLIIAEKPSVALRLAIALGNGKVERKRGQGRTSYFEIHGGEGTVYIAPAVGHIFTIRQADSAKGYPVLNIEWAPSYLVNKKAEFTKDYLDTLTQLGKKCGMFINACDFDLEGTVIGTNIIRHLNKGAIESNARRMKFSTTTSRDLLTSYNSLTGLDMNNFYAGETRHMLDWLWGINLSRALMRAINEGSVQNREVLSIGRVQGPTLAILAKREEEIGAFVSKPFWRVFVILKGVDFANVKGDIFKKEEAETINRETTANLGSGMVETAEEKKEELYPYPPFDLTSLQLEASRALHFDPSATLALAQALYERSYISYPRTSSQKLPAILGLPGIIAELTKNPAYSEIAKRLIAEKRFRPREGSKFDEAHPAIFPTGVIPKNLSRSEEMLYDLIARRFLSCFEKPAVISTGKIVVRFGNEKYAASGKRVIERNWLDSYRYARVEEATLPVLKSGERARGDKAELRELKTLPPKRYTKASIIAELEKKDLGTKATRAQIIDTLYRRNYVDGSTIMVTRLGMTVYKALSENCPMIVDANTTALLEEDMEKIAKGDKKEEEVVDEGKRMLLDALKLFDSNRKKIAEEMKSALGVMNAANVLGKCPVDGGDLVVRRSRIGKQFVGCTNYPKCTNTYPLPQHALVIPTGKICKYCGAPIVKLVLGKGRAFETDLNIKCREGKGEAEKKEEQPKVIKSGGALRGKRSKQSPKARKSPTVRSKKAKV